MRDTYNGLTNNFIEELEEFLNEKFDGEWEMNFQVDGRAIDIRLLMSPEERVVVKKEKTECGKYKYTDGNIIQLFPK